MMVMKRVTAIYNATRNIGFTKYNRDTIRIFGKKPQRILAKGKER